MWAHLSPVFEMRANDDGRHRLTGCLQAPSSSSPPRRFPMRCMADSCRCGRGPEGLLGRSLMGAFAIWGNSAGWDFL
jgi:hypothetical protein